MKKQKFNMTISNTPENREFMALIKQWSDMIPTLFFLDLCTISHIKTSLERGSDIAPSEPKSLAWLRDNDVPHNGISYLPALMEKASDTRSNFDTEGLTQEAIRDLTSLKAFFKHARIVEDVNFASNYVETLMGIHPECLGDSYHDFLNFVNGLRIFNTIAPAKRLNTVKNICEKAESLGISKGHPLILASLACIYGCVSAKKVLKFKEDPTEFSSSNALGDVQVIQRVGKLTHMIEQSERGYPRTQFVTDDRHLQDFYKLFFVNEAISSESDGAVTTSYEMTIQANMLFPDLFDERGGAKGEAENAEILEIYALVGFPVETSAA
ncbi:hypothetical protein [Pseudomonas aeruginosa]|uniref:hypothetical protein n=1 Tax=Pseudomonas aeruginosa TaxID=287 RepID=UPI001F1F979B|nr:hypothetical protein [Pseudomonas aeruginosa]MBX5697158.1 hypothetical protein [Pseudomonas aeruginosa]MDA3169855.1 hypothetical protein [Pseudomonas aeruginosa]MDU0675713.1 hypothetical protein [Pseudomonas aeruginosa]HCF9472351.1 hypothetical protein [Pseudomonas aeruginosa]